MMPRDSTEAAEFNRLSSMSEIQSDELMDPGVLLQRHRGVMPSWLSLYYDQPMEIVRGSGRHVTASDGRTYLDFFAGILTNMLGYNVPEVNDALRAQIDTGILHTSTLYLMRQQVELAERIADLSGIPDAKVFFTTSGTEANEAAMLLATQARKSNQVLALKNSYHGRSFGTMAITGNRSWSASSLTPFVVGFVHSGYRYRSPYRDLSDEDYNAACARELRSVLTTRSTGDVACLIAEPIQGVGGFATPPDGYLAHLDKVLKETGILLISDEVQTGWGRTGEHFWGYQAHGVTPDIITFAKGVGNGLSLAGVVARGELMDCLTANSISTFGGNPLSAAGGRAVLDYVIRHQLKDNAAARGAELMTGLREATEANDAVGDLRGKGLMIGIELVHPGTDEPDVAAASQVQERARKAGLLIGKGGLYGNVLRIAPPLTVTADEVAEGLDALISALGA